MICLVESARASDRTGEALRFLGTSLCARGAVVIGSSRDAADDLVRRFARTYSATFGLHRFSLTQLAIRLALPELTRQGFAPASELGTEALAARVVFEVMRRGSIEHFAPVALRPGFATALAATLRELRASGVIPSDLETLEAGGRDLAAFLREYENQLSSAATVDREAIFNIARAAIARREDALIGAPLVLLDVAISSRPEVDFVADLCSSAAEALILVPAGDERALSSLKNLAVKYSRATTSADTSLQRLQGYVFSDLPSLSYVQDESVSMFSAPGEGRECVEVARRILHEAESGTPFDQMAVLVRAPNTYAALLETALSRAQIPAYFARGTSRPDPAGRALLVLLACAAEGLSAQRFAEYLSLGQVPPLNQDGTPPAGREVWAPATDETLSAAQPPLATEKQNEDAERPDSDAESVVAGSLRAPRRWERLLVEAAVVGSRERWSRRLNGLGAELKLQIAGAVKMDPGSPRLSTLQRQLANLEHLRRFALPVIEALDSLPREATWGRWLEALESLAPMVLRHPKRVLSVLAELKPMSAVGPVGIEEVRQVLSRRLTELGMEPPARRFGQVFVGTMDQARGRSFQVVFVPGMAERIFPQRLREDPILRDSLRRKIDAAHPLLRTRSDRAGDERLLLRLACGAAEKWICFSYPRVEVALARPRVPSFYALDVARMKIGHLPSVEVFEREAADKSNALLAWPAPNDPDRAIDDVEHDLSILRPLLQAEPKTVSGRARYLMDLNAALGRSLRSRWYRWHNNWTYADGLCEPTPATRLALVEHRLTARAYSPTSLQLYALCPYRFALGAIYRLEPRREAVSIQTLDPLTRGTIFHTILARVVRVVLKNGWLVNADCLSDLLEEADCILDGVADEFREQLFPAIERVWDDEIEEMRSDLHGWIHRWVEQQGNWSPSLVEFAFGLPNNGDDDLASIPEPAKLAGGFLLHGRVDLLEQNNHGSLRVTDYKTGKDRTEDGMVVGHGELLQPVLYSISAEVALGKAVDEARLWYCTSNGGYHERKVPLNAEARKRATQVLGIIDQAISQAFLPPAPKQGVCRWCDFRPVCGPYEEIRVARKKQEPLADLLALREME